MLGKAQEVPGSARNGLVLREGSRKNHYTEFEFYRATTRRFSVSRPFRPEPSGSRGRGTPSRWHGDTLQPLVAPETASFRVSAPEKTITQMTEYRIFPPGLSARHRSLSRPEAPLSGYPSACPRRNNAPTQLPRWSPAVTARQRAAALPRCSRNAPPTLLIAPAPRAFPAPGSCGQGPKRPPRPASGMPAG